MVGEKVAAALLPPLLLHAYVPPPLAVSVALAPLQIVTVAGVMAAVGIGFTVTAMATRADSHPVALNFTAT